ncbi:hypothetical protein ACA910_009023 [Epithemia clementina (nom. ined.)]
MVTSNHNTASNNLAIPRAPIIEHGRRTIITTAPTSQSLHQGGFELWLDDEMVIPIGGGGGGNGNGGGQPAAERIVVSTRQVHTITLKRSHSVFHGFLLRLGSCTLDTPYVLHIPEEQSKLVQLASECAFHSRAVGVTHVSLETNKTLVSMELYFENDDVELPLDITIIAAANTSSYHQFYSRFLLDAIDPTTPNRDLQDSNTTETTSPSPSPTELTTLQPTDNNTATETPTSAPVVTLIPSSLPSQMASDVPSFVLSFEPSTFPSVQPSIAPSIQLSMSPSIQPSTLPSLLPSVLPSTEPSLEPSSSPSGLPSVAPTVDPSAVPSRSPTFMPSQAPSEYPSSRPSSTPITTPPPSPIPTSTVIFVSDEISGAFITFDNVAKLDERAQRSFEGAMDGWYDSNYDDSLRQRRRTRQLALAPVQGVHVTTFFRDQRPMEENNTIIYDQVVVFKTLNASIDMYQVLLQPFQDSALNFFLRERLRASNDAFAELPNDLIAAPYLPSFTSTKSEGDDSVNYFLVSGIGVGAAAIISLVTLIAFKYSIARRRTKYSNPPPTEAAPPYDFSVQDTDYEDNSKPVDTNVSLGLDGSFGYGDQSVSTAEYDYAKAFGTGMGERSVASSVSGAKLKTTIFADLDLERGRSGNSALGNSPHSPRVDEYLEEDADDDDVDDAIPMIQTKTFEVDAPAGKLGVVIDTPDNGPPVVHAVKDSSVLLDQLQVGDKLLKVDGDDVTTMTAVKVSRLISQRSHNEVRRLTLRRALPD